MSRSAPIFLCGELGEDRGESELTISVNLNLIKVTKVSREFPKASSEEDDEKGRRGEMLIRKRRVACEEKLEA